MESIDNFIASLSEIDILLTYSKHNQKTIHKYQLFNKVAIVLLSTKFEVFLEEFIEEHSLKILEGHTNHTLPEELKNRYLRKAVDIIYNDKNGTKLRRCAELLKILCHDTEFSISELHELRPATKFNYGKHGQKEIEKLFTEHGLKDFIINDEVKMTLEMINSLISIRNNVIHQDSSPSITHQTIHNHKKNLMDFVNLLKNDIESNAKTYYNN